MDNNFNDKANDLYNTFEPHLKANNDEQIM